LLRQRRRDAHRSLEGRVGSVSSLRPRTAIRFGRHVAVALAVMVTVCVANTRVSAADDWSLQNTPDVGQYTGFSGVSCPSVIECVAVGPLGRAFGEIWNGLTWSLQNGPALGGVFPAVSCASSSMCMAVGAGGAYSGLSWQAEVWNGKAWSVEPLRSQVPAAVSGVPSGVSCPSSQACVVVGNDGFGMFAASWNGSGWSFTTLPLPVGAGGGVVGGLSCSSADACSAIGTYDVQGSTASYPIVERWNGETWSPQAIPSPVGGPFEPQGISCPSTNECVAVGSWQQLNTPTQYPYAAQWNGVSWSPQTGGIPGASGALKSVSCVADNECIAVGGSPVPFWLEPLVEHWDGHAWSDEDAPIVNGLWAVSCASATVCMAVGETRGYGAPFAESTAAPKPGRAALTAVPRSCVTHRFTARVIGRAISSVNWALDGRTLRGHTVDFGIQYSLRVKLPRGRHTLTVTVAFDAATPTPTITLRRSVAGCGVR
jgi:hypothetical protein